MIDFYSSFPPIIFSFSQVQTNFLPFRLINATENYLCINYSLYFVYIFHLKARYFFLSSLLSKIPPFQWISLSSPQNRVLLQIKVGLSLLPWMILQHTHQYLIYIWKILETINTLFKHEFYFINRITITSNQFTFFFRRSEIGPFTTWTTSSEKHNYVNIRYWLHRSEERRVAST